MFVTNVLYGESSMSNRFRVVILVIGLMSSPFAHSTTTCSGPINYLALNTGGVLYVNVGHGVWSICSASALFNGVDPATCRAWYAGLLAAQKAGDSITLYFDTGTCATLGSWVAVTPNLYHMDLNGG